MQVPPFHEHTPIRTLPQGIAPHPPTGPGYGSAFRGVGLRSWAPSHKSSPYVQSCWRTEPASLPTWPCSLRPPDVDISHALTTAVSHVMPHPGLCEYARPTPPALLAVGAARTRVRPRRKGPLHHRAHANGKEARDTKEVVVDDHNHDTARLWVADSSVTGRLVGDMARGV